MGARGLVMFGVLLGLLVAAGLALALVRGGRERRAPLLVALTAVLLITASGGLAWVRMGSGSSAPVGATLTLFSASVDCSGGAGDCAEPNALVATRADDGSVRWEVTLPKGASFASTTPLVQDGVVYAYVYPGPAAVVGLTVTYVLTAWRGRDGTELWHVPVLSETTVAPLTYVAGDQLVVLDTTVAGSAGYHFKVVRASDGAVLGTTTLPAAGGPPPVVVDDTAYQCFPDDTITATQLTDGAPVWRVSALGPAQQTMPNCTSTLVAGGVVFASMFAVSGGSSGKGRPGQVVALNATTGQVLWRYATATPYASATPNLLAAGDGLVVLREDNAYAPSSIVAIRASDGTPAWRHDGFPPLPVVKGCCAARNAAVGGNLVLVGGEGFTLWAFHAADGTLAWRTSADRHYYSTVGIVDGTVFVHSGFAGYGSPFPEPSVDGNSYIAALRARDGVPYWQTTRGAVGGLVMGSVDGGV